MLLPILGVGTLLFIAYVFFTLRTHTSAQRSDDDETQDLHTIEKMKEFDLIKETKKIQTLTEKNKLFQRAYENKYGKIDPILNKENEVEENESEQITTTNLPKNVTTYEPSEEEDVDFGNEFYAARTESTNEKDDEELIAELELQKLSDNFKNFDALELSDIQPSEDFIQNQQEQNHFKNDSKQLEDDYTASENMTITLLHQEFLRIIK